MSFAIRLAGEHDIAGMAQLRAQTWGTQPYWAARIGGYFNGEHSPQQAVAERVAFVALDRDVVVGLVAGHRTKRFGCDEHAMLLHLDGTKPEALRPGEPWGYTRIFLGHEPRSESA